MSSRNIKGKNILGLPLESQRVIINKCDVNDANENRCRGMEVLSTLQITRYNIAGVLSLGCNKKTFIPIYSPYHKFILGPKVLIIQEPEVTYSKDRWR